MPYEDDKFSPGDVLIGSSHDRLVVMNDEWCGCCYICLRLPGMNVVDLPKPYVEQNFFVLDTDKQRALTETFKEYRCTYSGDGIDLHAR